ncbi:MAG: hypothetical protein ACK44A_04890 [Roseateles sp.]
MLTFDWPDALRPASVEWQLIVPQLQGRSVFDGSSYAETMGAPRWAFSVTTGPRKLSEVPAWEAFFDRLRGGVNRVRAWDWRREAPLGVATGAPVVRVAGSGASLQLEGWTAGVTGILLAGSWFRVNGELKRLSVSMNSDGFGRSTAQFEPPLRAVAPAGAPLLLVKPTATFVMTSEPPKWRQDGARVGGVQMSFEEDLRP